MTIFDHQLKEANRHAAAPNKGESFAAPRIPGASPCPFCGSEKLMIQTPASTGDGLVRDEYIRCFECGAKGPVLSHEPISITDSGERPLAPIVEAWNQRC